MQSLLPIAQIVVALLLITLVLLQKRGTALGSTFGGQGGGFYATRRGIERKIFWLTIICGSLFIVLAIVNLLI